MTTLYTISDDRTKFCRKGMKAHNGVWNPVTETWMFRDAGDHANAACERYRATRPSVAQIEALMAPGRKRGPSTRSRLCRITPHSRAMTRRAC